MKISTMLGVVLFAIMSFRPAPVVPEATQKSNFETVYCGYISESCNGPITVQIGFYGAGPYLIGIQDGNGNPMTVTVRSISQVSGSSNIFALDIIYYCNGVEVNYVGNAYCVVC
jgi:hypothetical protein